MKSNNNNNRTILMVGAVSMISIPFITSVSCTSSNEKPAEPTIEPAQITGIGLIKTPTGLSYSELQANPITLTTVQKVFGGIDKTKYGQFTISMSGTTGQVTMNLTSKKGFIFPNDQTIIESIFFTHPTPKPTVETRFTTGNGIIIWGYADGTGTIMGVSTFFNSTNLIIEESYTSQENLNIYIITSIGDMTFTNSPLASLDLSKNTLLTNIGSRAFYSSQLASLDLSKNTSLISIGRAAFQNSLLTSLILPESVTTIGDEAFRNSLLTSLDLSKNTLLTSIGRAAFTNSPLASLILPDSITSIGNEAFFESLLTSLILPESVTSIGDMTFTNSPLASLDLSKNTLLTNIGSRAFYSSQLASLDLSKNTSLISIRIEAFYNSPLTSLILPESVTSIGERAFQGTKNILSANLDIPIKFMNPNELRRIGITINPYKM